MFPVASVAVLTLASSAAQNHVFRMHSSHQGSPEHLLLIVSALTALLLIPNSSIWPEFGPSSSILNLGSVVLELR